jgi:hypothetical protein
VLYLRQHYHFGPGRIADYLRRFHDVLVAVSSVHRILLRHGMNRLPANQKHRAHAKRWQRYDTRLRRDSSPPGFDRRWKVRGDTRAA